MATSHLIRSPDTTEEAFAVQTSILSRMTDAQRLAVSRRLTERAKSMAIAEIRHRHPEYAEPQSRLALVRLLVGDDLVRQASSGIHTAGPGIDAMTDPSPRSFVGRLTQLLTSLDIPYMITGSVASSLWGRPRATFDVDVVIDPTLAQIVQLCDSVATTGYVHRPAALDALAARGMFNIIDYASGEKADLIIRKDTAFHRSEFARRISRSTDEGELVFVTAEDSILSKLIWAKQAGSERQLSDAAQTLHRLAGQLDARYLERWARQLDVTELLRRCGGEDSEP